MEGQKMKFDFFGSKAERAEKKLEEKKKKHDQYIKDTDRLRDVEMGTEIIDKSKSRKEKEEFNRKVAKVRASLKIDEEKMLTKMVVQQEPLNQFYHQSLLDNHIYV